MWIETSSSTGLWLMPMTAGLAWWVVVQPLLTVAPPRLIPEWWRRSALLPVRPVSNPWLESRVGSLRLGRERLADMP